MRVILGFVAGAAALSLKSKGPEFATVDGGKIDTKDNAAFDCGGKGESDTVKMQNIVQRMSGAARVMVKVGNAAQDATNGNKGQNYPDHNIWAEIRRAKHTAKEAISAATEALE